MKNKIHRFIRKFNLENFFYYTLIAIVFMANTTVLNAQTHSVQVRKDIKMEQVSVQQLVDKLIMDFKYSFFIVDKEVGKTIVSVNLRQASIDEILKSAFKDKEIIFSIKENIITISAKQNQTQQPRIKNSSKIVTGIIKNEYDEAIIGATIIIDGTNIGTITDINGKFSIDAPLNAKLVISFIGYRTSVVSVENISDLSVVLKDDNIALEEIVVIGYGTVNKKDMTGSVTNIKAPSLNKGLSVSSSDYLVGKVPGLLIVPGDGGPGSGASIRIRGLSSIQASNSPMIVIDGVAISSDANLGTSNVLSFVNPNDIESFTVLKDASATAIYGSRASNGVILITTKKGSGLKGFKVEYSSSYSANVNSSQVPVLSPGEFRQFMDEYYPINTTAGAYAHNMMDYRYQDNSINQFNTNWQDYIFQTGLSTDQNVSFSGGGSNYPFRVSIGYTDQTGTLIGSRFQRYTSALNFSPKFFAKHLSLDVNLKGMLNPNRYVDSGVINSAASFDPTKPVYAYNTSANDKEDVSDLYGGYFQWLNPDNSINRNGSQNPVSALLNNSYNTNTASRFLGNIQADYALHFLPELHVNLNLGIDVTTQNGMRGNYPGSYSSYTDAILPPGQGRYTSFDGIRKNELLDFYVNYQKDILALSSKVSLMAGYSRQDFYRNDNSETYSNNTEEFESLQISTSTSPGEYKLRSFYGRFNYNIMDKYLLTATLRADGTSRFSPANRWGYFPSAAFAWRVSEENFLKQFSNLDNLKIRLSYGVTGQQDIGTDFYPYIPTYNLSLNTSSSQYYFGSGDNAMLYQLLSPKAYNENIKWESATTYNTGLDFSFYKSKISGSIDLFIKNTTDLLNSIPIPAGANFTNQMTSNIGSMLSKGVEVSLNFIPVQTKEFNWNIGFSTSFVNTKINKLTAVFNPEYIGIPTGGISMGTGNTIQIMSEGYTPNTFYVYQQVYDNNGFPIQNAFVDQNNDGIIDNGDLVRKHSPLPDVFGGINMQFIYKRFDIGFNSHYSIGNWVFNDYNSARSSADYTFSNGQTLRNVPAFVYYKSKFSLPINVQQAESDLFLENASFLKLDNITMGYLFKNLFMTKLAARLSFTAQNILTITKFSGSDPEISNGIANNAWPRPRVFVVGLNVNF